MRGFLTTDNRYYETENGQIDPTDREVPVRPSENHSWDEKEGWRGCRKTDDYRVDKVVFGIRDVGYILAVAAMGLSLYFAITSKIEIQSIQIQAIKEAQTSNTQTLHFEIEDLKKRLDQHVERGER